MSLYVERKLMVADQEMNAVITRADHVSLSGSLTVRGIIYNVHAHYTRQNGQWAFHNAPDDRSVSISGAYSNDKRNWNKRPAPTVRDFIVSSMVVALNDFVQDNGQLFKEAEVGRLDHEIEGMDAKIAKMELELHQAKEARLKVIAERFPKNAANPFEKGTTEHGLYDDAHLRFCQEQQSGYLDDRGVMHPPTSRNTAEILWRAKHERATKSITEGRARDRAQTASHRQADQPRTHQAHPPGGIIWP
jgi:hypothetical protein